MRKIVALAAGLLLGTLAVSASSQTKVVEAGACALGRFGWRVVGGAAACSWVTDGMSALLFPRTAHGPCWEFVKNEAGLNAHAMRSQ